MESEFMGLFTVFSYLHHIPLQYTCMKPHSKVSAPSDTCDIRCNMVDRKMMPSKMLNVLEKKVEKNKAIGYAVSHYFKQVLFLSQLFTCLTIIVKII